MSAAPRPVLIAGRWREAERSPGSFRAEDPARAVPIGPEYPISGAPDLEAALAAGSAAAPVLAATPSGQIADFLDAYASLIERDAQALSERAHEETALPVQPRLRDVELPRTTFQLRQAARAAREHSWTQPVIDTAANLRTHLAPLGKPVLVFGPNNFPLAFNAVAGSDFASAIAARNPVIAKAHPSHPGTSEHLARLAHEAVLATGLPPATVQMLYHMDGDMGLALAGDARVGAVGFTGSRRGGLAIKAAADAAGVPAYLEMSSINPVFVLDGALVRDGAALAKEFMQSCTLGGGQFCTNPGVIVVPAGETGDAFVAECATLFASAPAAVLFSAGVREQLGAAIARLCGAGATLLVGGTSASPGYRYAPTLLATDGYRFVRDRAFQTEAFGPASLVVRTTGEEDMLAVATAFEGNLTAAVYADPAGDAEAWARLAQVLRPRVGRLLGNRMPTGVAVSPAMNHGGPYPATGHPGFTAVGMPAAIRRFAALHCYDNVPDALLPPDLRDRNPGALARCIDGIWVIDDIHHLEHH